jgi:hypothetical protein
MSKNSCEKCGKEFNSKSHYNQHQNRKTPCVSENKIKELIDKSVEDTLIKLNIQSSSSISVTECLTNDALSHTIQPMQKISVNSSTFDELKKYYDETLNIDKNIYKSGNDESTPIDCVSEMISKIPEELWKKNDLSILDPCCGNGNFSIPILFELLKYHDKQTIVEQILEFNDSNESKLENVRNVFCSETFQLQITNHDYITFNNPKKYDLIVANPPCAKLLDNGKRASKNHNLIKDFIEILEKALVSRFSFDL